MEIKEYIPKHRDENFQNLVIVGGRGSKELSSFLNLKVVVNDEVKTFKDLLEFIYNDTRLYTEETINKLEKRVEELEKRLEQQITTQNTINQNLIEAIKEEGVI